MGVSASELNERLEFEKKQYDEKIKKLEDQIVILSNKNISNKENHDSHIKNYDLKMDDIDNSIVALDGKSLKMGVVVKNGFSELENKVTDLLELGNKITDLSITLESTNDKIDNNLLANFISTYSNLVYLHLKLPINRNDRISILNGLLREIQNLIKHNISKLAKNNSAVLKQIILIKIALMKNLEDDFARLNMVEYNGVIRSIQERIIITKNSLYEDEKTNENRINKLNEILVLIDELNKPDFNIVSFSVNLEININEVFSFSLI